MCRCVCVGVGVYGSQREVSDPIELKLGSYKLPKMDAANHSDPLEEQQTLLATEPSPQP